MYKIIDKLNDKQTAQLINLYKQCWWAKNRNADDVSVMLRNSEILGVSSPEDDLIGFARFITDGVYKALILDVIVDEKYREKGIGVRLFNAIVSHSKIANVEHLELYCTFEMMPFYEKWGFTDKLPKLVFMRRDNQS